MKEILKENLIKNKGDCNFLSHNCNSLLCQKPKKVEVQDVNSEFWGKKSEF